VIVNKVEAELLKTEVDEDEDESYKQEGEQEYEDPQQDDVASEIPTPSYPSKPVSEPVSYDW
jgi:hypothetical protein